MKNLILTLVLITAISGCRSAAVIEDNDLGSFRGKLTLLGVDGNPLPQQSGASIQIEGTAFATTSDTAGEWNMTNVPAGIYNILCQKPGFDTLVIPQIEFSGAGTAFLMSSAIQAIPLDSLVFTVTDTGEWGDSSHAPPAPWFGTLLLVGSVTGPDQLKEGMLSFTLSPTSQPQQTYFSSATIQIASNGQFSLSRPYNEPTILSGTIVTVRTTLMANWPSTNYVCSARAWSPYTVTRTITLP